MSNKNHCGVLPSVLSASSLITFSKNLMSAPPHNVVKQLYEWYSKEGIIVDVFLYLFLGCITVWIPYKVARWIEKHEE
ncbi:hypothetical protein Cyrtocomes_00509 [Candidatus Cyrtobacter comes]|uniref:Uncharacterized protein n=1 Tax=Candidatus Cyrtobacter comes TaxID=675776 RepID=A0ABU5L7P0_9RICK|nr:hypothetical protein [Candidatus Cyrtobacter comes]MDZ5762139.1 hypothetical protein [Candidatus Cyrtobacter comes]